MTKNTRTWFKRLGEGLGERGWCQTLSDLKMLTKRIFKMQLWLDLWLAFSWCSDTFTEQMTDFCRITNLFPYITNSTMCRVNPQCYIFLCQLIFSWNWQFIWAIYSTHLKMKRTCSQLTDESIIEMRVALPDVNNFVHIEYSLSLSLWIMLSLTYLLFISQRTIASLKKVSSRNKSTKYW